jgi:hypothetical protein
MFKEGGGYILIGAVEGYIWRCVLFILIMFMFLLSGRIWGYVYQQRCRSFVILVYLNCICGIVQMYLVIGPSFQCATHSVRSILLHVRPVSSIC